MGSGKACHTEREVMVPCRTEHGLALSPLLMLPSAHVNRVGVRVVCFRSSIEPTPPIPLSRNSPSRHSGFNDLEA
jgi:hypothetical protein